MAKPKRKGAIIGYGFIAEKGHLPAYKSREEFEIVAVADVSAARRQAAMAVLPPGTRIYEDHASLIAKEGKTLDFVDVTTPPYAHAPIAHAALDAGLHVLCEKPLATSVAEGRSLLEHAARAKRVLFPSHNYRHAPVIKAVRQVLDANLIGKVSLVTLHTFRNTHARGVPEWNTHWRREKKFSGGGIAMDHGSHTFYLALDWMKSEPTAFTAKMSTTNGFDTEDNFSGTITFPTGIATVHLSWTAGVRKVIYTVHGDRGAIRVEDDDVEVAVMEPGTGPGRSVTWEMKKERVASEWMDASHAGWFRSLFGQFGDAMDKGEHVGKDARIALKCLELVDAAYASAADGSRERTLVVERWGARPVLDLACSIGVYGLLVVIALAYSARLASRGRARSARADREGTSALLPKGPIEMMYWVLRPSARACLALGIVANTVSLGSLVFGLAAGVAAGAGHLGIAAALAVLSALGDVLDGVVARESGTASDAGEVLDASVDRYVEFAIMGGLAVHFRDNVVFLALTLFALLASFMVSYSTAKAEALHVKPPRGAMRRAERAIYLLLALALAPLVAHFAPAMTLPIRFAPSAWSDVPVLAALALIATVGNASAARRLISVATSVRARSEAAKPIVVQASEVPAARVSDATLIKRRAADAAHVTEGLAR